MGNDEKADMSNNPKVLNELTPIEQSWLMDVLHEEWNRRVVQVALRSDYSTHVVQYHKHTASRLLRLLDHNADTQGFGNL